MARSKRTSPTDRIRSVMQTARIGNASELARRLGLPRQTVHRWLTDGIANITYKNLLKLADTLNVNARWIVFGEVGPLKPPIKQRHEADAAGTARVLKGDLRRQWLLFGRSLLELQTKRDAVTKSPQRQSGR